MAVCVSTAEGGMQQTRLEPIGLGRFGGNFTTYWRHGHFSFESFVSIISNHPSRPPFMHLVRSLGTEYTVKAWTQQTFNIYYL